MAPRLTIEDLQNGAKAGHSQTEYVALLEHLGFVFVRNTRHGAKYVHEGLRAHPDLSTRQMKSWILVPVGKRLPEYVADDILERHRLLEDMEGERPHA
jgi:hypothetical protein